jgi:nascent polypeptide-associated complex subunit beta
VVYDSNAQDPKLVWSFQDAAVLGLILISSSTVNSALPSNTIAITGQGEDKELPELVPGILNQLGPDSLASLRKLAESYQAMAQKQQGAEGKDGETKEADEEDVPDLVESFDVEETAGADEKEGAKLEELN